MSNNYQYPIINKDNGNSKGNYDIHERIFKFIVRVLAFLNTIPFSYSNQVCKNQIIRSVTSMGANDQEADGSLTSKDFVYKSTVVRKEGKETLYWLKLIKATNQPSNELDQIIVEGLEINAIVSSIIKNTNITIQSNKR